MSFAVTAVIGVVASVGSTIYSIETQKEQGRQNNQRMERERYAAEDAKKELESKEKENKQKEEMAKRNNMIKERRRYALQGRQRGGMGQGGVGGANPATMLGAMGGGKSLLGQ